MGFIMKVKRISMIVFAVLCAGSLSACSYQASEDSAVTGDTGASCNTGEQIANPFSEAATLEDAAAVTGFPLTVPDAPKDYPDTVIRVMNKEMIEVIYEKGTDEGYRIRKAAGSSEIAGDYNTYENSETVTVGPCQLSGLFLRGYGRYRTDSERNRRASVGAAGSDAA